MKLNKTIIKLLTLISVSSFLITGCGDNQSKQQNPSQVNEPKDNTSIVDIDDIEEDEKPLYPSMLKNEDLPKPKDTLDSRDDLIYLLDYLTYYMVDEYVTVNISEEYKKNIRYIDTEIEHATDNGYITTNYFSTLDKSNYRKENKIRIRMGIREIDLEETQGNIIPEVLPNLDYQLLENNKLDYDSLYLVKNQKGKIRTSTPSQLYYAISQKYIPVCEEGSYVETLHNNILDVLSKTYRSEDDKLSNLKRMYEYITHNITYDKLVAERDTHLVERNKAFYIDGVFNNKLAVCLGMAQSYAALCSYVGYENYVICGLDDYNNRHAYNYVEYDGKWYLSCPTWGSFVEKIDNKYYQIPQYNMFLTTYDTAYQDAWTFESLSHVDIEKKIEKEPYDVHKFMNSESNSIEEIFNNIISCNKDKQKGNFSYEFKLIDGDDNEISKLKKLLDNHYPEKSISIMKNPSLKGQNCTILFINK